MAEPIPLDRGQVDRQQGHSCRVVFTPSGTSGEVPAGTTVLAAARQLGVDLDSVCGGRGLCGRCLVTPTGGDHPRWGITADPSHLGPWTATEQGYGGRRPIGAGQRLGCAAILEGDTVIDVPPASQLHRPVVAKEVMTDGLTVDPLVTLHYLDLGHESETRLAGGDSVVSLIIDALTTGWGERPITVDPSILGAVHAATAGAGAGLTVALRRPDPGHDPWCLVGVWPGLVETVVGAAIDVGSTTVAGHLCDLTSGEILASVGAMNPQIRFGEDLMSRVSYAMTNEGGAQALTADIHQCLDEVVGQLLTSAGLDRDRLLDVVVVGNPVMHHLVLGIDPTPLGQAPFPLATADPVDGSAALAGIQAPWARLHVAPCIAGHVGGDTAAAILAEGPHRSPARQLLVDVGTNAEIVFGSEAGLLAASSPTGPAFEGAQLSSGQRATVGAIERVRIDRATLEPRFRVIGVEPWSDEDGFEAALAQGPGRLTGICGSGIIEVVAELFLAGVIDAKGVIRGEASARSPRVVADGRTYTYQVADGIGLTQNDVRAIQLAKAALRAGIELVMERAGSAGGGGTPVDEIRLAGAFGAKIDPRYAMVIGLIPDCALDRVRAVGNAAGSGAVRALVSAAERAEMAEVVSLVSRVETATEPRFQDHFVAALPFPHQSAPTTHLAAAVDLPQPQPAATGRRRRARSRPRPTPTKTHEARS